MNTSYGKSVMCAKSVSTSQWWQPKSLAGFAPAWRSSSNVARSFSPGRVPHAVSLPRRPASLEQTDNMEIQTEDGKLQSLRPATTGQKAGMAKKSSVVDFSRCVHRLHRCPCRPGVVARGNYHAIDIGRACRTLHRSPWYIHFDGIGPPGEAALGGTVCSADFVCSHPRDGPVVFTRAPRVFSGLRVQFQRRHSRWLASSDSEGSFVGLA